MKKKVLAFALAAAMVLTSVPMNSVHAEEGTEGTETIVNGETQSGPENSDGGEAVVQAGQEEVQSEPQAQSITVDETTLITILDTDFSDGKPGVEAFGSPAGVGIDKTTIAGNDTAKLKFTATSTITKDLGDAIDSGIVKIVVETHSTASPKGNIGFRVLSEETEGTHALINIGHYGGVNLYTTDKTAPKTQNNTDDGYKQITPDSNSRGMWVRLETLIDLNASKDAGSLKFETTVYRKASYDGSWADAEKYVVTDEDYRNAGDAVDWTNKADGKPAENHSNGCANELASLNVRYIALEGTANGAYIDNVYIGATDVVALDDVEVTQAPAKTTYSTGETLDLTGMKLTETYTKGAPRELTTVDAIKAAYEITGFNPTAAGKQTITVASKTNPEIKTTFEVTVEAAAEIVGLKELLSYKGEIDDVAELGFTDKDGKETNVLSLSATGVAGNSSQKLLIGDAATVKKDLKYYGLSEGIVKINLELNQNTKNAEYRILDAGGKALINFGQFSNTNLYYGNQTGGKVGGGTTGPSTAYKKMVPDDKNNWLRFETEIDLNASNTSGSLQFKTVIYLKDSYEKDWEYKATVTGEDYKSVNGWAAAETDKQEGATAHTNGCATDGLNKFSVGSIELAATGAGVAIDNIEILATDPAALQKVEVKDKPTRENYIVGTENHDWTGLVLTETYSNGKNVSFTEDLALEEIERKYEITGFNTDTQGEKTITVTNRKDAAVTCDFRINVKDVKIVSIHVTPPAKLDYYVGDKELDRTGMVVKAVYSDSSDQVTLAESDYKVSDLKAAAEGKETITVTSVTKNAAGEAVADTFEVTIKKPVVESIEVTKMPSKMSYKMNEEDFNPAGMEITVTYDSGKTDVINVADNLADCRITGFDNTAEAASQTITVTYQEKTDTFTIRIVDPSKFAPIEYNFDFNIDGSKTGSGWTGIFVNKKDGKTKGLSDYGFSAEKGYGINTTVTALAGRSESVTTSGDYVSIPADVYNDFVLLASANGSFDVVLENGTYNVQIVVGSTEGGTTEVKINNNSAYTGKASNKKGADNDFKVIEIAGVAVTDGKMSIKPVSDSLARTNAIIISNISAPTGLTGGFKADDLCVSLSWNESLGCEKYNVYRIGADGYIDCVAEKVEGTSYADTDIAVLETYTYYVRGVSAKGLETFATNKVKVTAGDENAVKPATPKNLTISDITSDSVTLTWDAVANAASYEIYWSDRDRTSLAGTGYATDGIEDYELIGTSKSNTFVLNLPTHIVRYFKVAAVGAGGKSELSELVKADIVKKFNTQAEYLDRGLIAIKTDYGVYLGWRLAGDEYAENASYVLYRDGAPIRTFTAEENTNFLDPEGTLESRYAVSVVLGGVESEKCEEVTVWENPYLEVPMDQPEPYWDNKLTEKATYTLNDKGVYVTIGDQEVIYNYKPNDTYIGDVDGDGEYELIVKWDGVSQDSSYVGYTSPVIIDCYKLDGTRLWRINLGVNIRAGAHYTQPVVADLDGDGKAEVMMKTAEGSYVTARDGKVIYVDGNTNPGDYRSEKGHVTGGPEYLTLFDGETGEVLDNIDYVPQRGSVSSWGDSAYNRSERYLSGAAYLDGEHLSAVFGRGYYKKSVVVAFDVVDKKIVQRWMCSSEQSENESLFGQGAHSFTVADVDGDGCQEIIYGSATIDHDGRLLYSLSDKKASSGSINGGHGDALRVTDMNLKNPGLEAFMVHEEHPNDGNVEMHDAGTGEYIYAIPGNADVGRGAAGDIDPRYEGVESWGNGSGDLGKLRAADGTDIGSRPSPANHMAWFGAGMGRKFVDHSYTGVKYKKGTDVLDNGSDTTGTVVVSSIPYIAEWDYENGKAVKILTAEECDSNNTTKGNPCFQADIFGDWREEIAWRTDDNQAIRIYTSWEVQDYRLYTLMHDPTYRAQMSCNGSAYNQSPDAGFYIGYDTELMQVPVPTLNILKAGEIPTPTPGPDEETELSRTEGVHAAEETFDADAIESKPELKAAIEEAIKAAGGEAADSQKAVEAITDLLRQKGEGFISAKEWSTKGSIISHQVRDIQVERVVTENGVERREPVTKDSFPANGIDIIVPLPNGVDTAKLSQYRFVVSHLITLDGCYDQRLGRTLSQGEIIEENVLEVSRDGLKLHIYSSSLFDTSVVLLDDTKEPGRDDVGDDEDDGLEETGDDKVSNPAQTGDHMGSLLWMWSVILAAAAAGIASILAVRLRRKK